MWLVNVKTRVEHDAAAENFLAAARIFRGAQRS